LQPLGITAAAQLPLHLAAVAAAARACSEVTIAASHAHLLPRWLLDSPNNWLLLFLLLLCSPAVLVFTAFAAAPPAHPNHHPLQLATL